MLHPAVLKSEFQGPDIAGSDQLSRFDTQVGLDLLDPFPVQNGLDASSCAEAEIVSPKGRAGQSKSETHRRCQLREGLSPNRRGGVIRIHAQMVGFIGDRKNPVGWPCLQSVL